MLVLFLSPPEIPLNKVPPIFVFLHPLSPSLLIRSSIFLSIYLFVNIVLSFAANLKLSMGVKVSSKTSSYYTKAPSFPKSLGPNTRSFTRTSPVFVEPRLNPSLCPKILSKDVLPLPLAPITAINYPGLANPDKPWSIYFLFSGSSLSFTITLYF